MRGRGDGEIGRIKQKAVGRKQSDKRSLKRDEGFNRWGD